MQMALFHGNHLDPHLTTTRNYQFNHYFLIWRAVIIRNDLLTRVDYNLKKLSGAVFIFTQSFGLKIQGSKIIKIAVKSRSLPINNVVIDTIGVACRTYEQTGESITWRLDLLCKCYKKMFTCSRYLSYLMYDGAYVEFLNLLTLK